ncbi:hypothetical protein KUCAC02_005668 [Chaenocephalus aceratus]|uniref:Uncharacterized protein n=1 Tax=Chaenocephalus aceratus TaxID=36190 RepID=A0ACB9WPZ3_CHAAC|nr:hypothetical protein KUCAC02_005668 [Chaenocephalus aceratus]
MNNLLDPTDSYTDQSESSFGDVPPPATPNRRASSCSSPLPERKGEAASETKPPPHPPPALSSNQRRSSTEFRPISPLPERKGEAASDLRALSPTDSLTTRCSQGTNPFATVKLRPTTTNDRSSPHIH